MTPSPTKFPGLSLTPRERQIAELVMKGLGNKEIGIRLGIQKGTVKAHLGSVFEKTGCPSRRELKAQKEKL